MIKSILSLVVFSAILFCGTGMMSAPKTAVINYPPDTVSVNPFHVRFIKEDGKPVDFKIGIISESLPNITIRVNNPYQLSIVEVILVRGRRPVVMQRFNGEQEIIIDKNAFLSNVQPGDRLMIEFKSVTVTDNKGKIIPIVLDIPVFNIPLI
jgi:hypothetical protein